MTLDMMHKISTAIRIDKANISNDLFIIIKLTIYQKNNFELLEILIV